MRDHCQPLTPPSQFWVVQEHQPPGHASTMSTTMLCTQPYWDLKLLFFLQLPWTGFGPNVLALNRIWKKKKKVGFALCFSPSRQHLILWYICLVVLHHCYCNFLSSVRNMGQRPPEPFTPGFCCFFSFGGEGEGEGKRQRLSKAYLLTKLIRIKLTFSLLYMFSKASHIHIHSPLKFKSPIWIKQRTD